MAYNDAYAPVMAGQPELRKSPVYEALTELDKATDLLGKSIEELSMRLQVVMIEDRPVAQEHPEPPRERVPVPLAAEIMDRRLRISIMAQAVVSLGRRLGV